MIVNRVAANSIRVKLAIMKPAVKAAIASATSGIAATLGFWCLFVAASYLLISRCERDGGGAACGFMAAIFLFPIACLCLVIGIGIGLVVSHKVYRRLVFGAPGRSQAQE